MDTQPLMENSSMKKFSNWFFFTLLLAFALILSLPFLNGVGCDVMFHVEPLPTGQVYGRCEFGQVYFTVDNKVTKEIYSARGYYGFLNNHYYIILTDRKILVKNKGDDMPVSNYFYRDVYSGLIVREEEGNSYILSSSPAPIMWKANVSGRLGFID